MRVLFRPASVSARHCAALLMRSCWRRAALLRQGKELDQGGRDHGEGREATHCFQLVLSPPSLHEAHLSCVARPAVPKLSLGGDRKQCSRSVWWTLSAGRQRTSFPSFFHRMTLIALLLVPTGWHIPHPLGGAASPSARAVSSCSRRFLLLGAAAATVRTPGAANAASSLGYVDDAGGEKAPNRICMLLPS